MGRAGREGISLKDDNNDEEKQRERPVPTQLQRSSENQTGDRNSSRALGKVRKTRSWRRKPGSFQWGEMHWGSSGEWGEQGLRDSEQQKVLSAEDTHPLHAVLLRVLMSCQTPSGPPEKHFPAGTCVCADSGADKWEEGRVSEESSQFRDQSPDSPHHLQEVFPAHCLLQRLQVPWLCTHVSEPSNPSYHQSL